MKATGVDYEQKNTNDKKMYSRSFIRMSKRKRHQ